MPKTILIILLLLGSTLWGQGLNEQLIPSEIVSKNKVYSSTPVYYYESGIDTGSTQYYDEDGFETYHLFKCLLIDKNSKLRVPVNCGQVEKTYNEFGQLTQIIISSKIDSIVTCDAKKVFTYNNSGLLETYSVFQPCDKINPKTTFYYYNKDNLLILELSTWPPTKYNHDTTLVYRKDSTVFKYDSTLSKSYCIKFENGKLTDSTVSDFSIKSQRKYFQVYNKYNLLVSSGYSIKDSLNRVMEIFHKTDEEESLINWTYFPNGLLKSYNTINEQGKGYRIDYIYEYFTD